MELSDKEKISDSLGFIAQLAQPIGLWGTVWSLSQSMIDFDLSEGIQAAISSQSIRTGQALWSTVGGLVIWFVAVLVQFIIQKRTDNGGSSD